MMTNYYCFIGGILSLSSTSAWFLISKFGGMLLLCGVM